MTVQFAPGSIRLRVTRAEFDSVPSGDGLRLAVAAPGGRWEIDVRCASAFSISLASGRLALDLPRADLADLLGRLPAREGLRWQADVEEGTIAVILEVDIRDRPRAEARMR